MKFNPPGPTPCRRLVFSHAFQQPGIGYLIGEGIFRDFVIPATPQGVGGGNAMADSKPLKDLDD